VSELIVAERHVTGTSGMPFSFGGAAAAFRVVAEYDPSFGLSARGKSLRSLGTAAVVVPGSAAAQADSSG